MRFKTSVDASEKQVIEAMQKIASHIKNPSKFSKAAKLAVQLVQAGSVKPGTSNHFFAILEAAMSSSSAPTDPSVRADYHALFSAAQDVTEVNFRVFKLIGFVCKFISPAFSMDNVYSTCDISYHY